jgi:BRCA1-associated protein
LLISQLDSQREWYEERSALLHSELSELKVIVGRLEAARLEDQKRLASELAALKAEDAARQEVFTRERTRAEQRSKAATDLARRLERELKEERAVSAGLLQNLSLAKTSATNAESERGKAEERVKEMEEQVRDVMFALEVQNKIGEGGVMGEVEGGSVVVPAPQADSGKKRKGRK